MALIDSLTLFLTTFWHVMLELAPWLLVGISVAGAMDALLPKGWLKRHFATRSGVIKAVLFGIPLPLCSCAVIPVGLGLKQQGAGNAPAVAFLISTPQTGVDSIFVTASLLGWPFAIFKMATALVTGVVGGWIQQLIDLRNGSENKSNEEIMHEMPASFQPLNVIEAPHRMIEPESEESTSLLGKLFLGAKHSEEMMRSIYLWLMVGVLISVAITLWIDEGALEGLNSYGTLASMFVTLLISLPWYVCAVESVPIAAALAGAGLPLGAIMVFLMAGPATNMATMGALWRGLGPIPTMVYLATIIVGSFAGGLIFEAWNPTMARSGGSFLVHHHTTEPTWWATACTLFLLAWLVRLVWLDFGKRPSK